MSEDEYMDFIQCRQTKFFSKGIKPVLSWLKLQRDGTELKFRKILEAFGYIMRYIVQRIVLQAVRQRNSNMEATGQLMPISSALTLSEYETAISFEEKQIKQKCDEWHDQITAFQVFHDESHLIDTEQGVDGQSSTMAKNKEKWDKLSEVERRDFMARVSSEAHFKQ